MAELKALFLQMPWATTQRPSIAIGILRRLCDEQGVAVEVLYPNMDMAAAVGFEIAGRFSNERHVYGLSEHLFAADLFGREAINSEEYCTAIARIMNTDSDKDTWRRRFADSTYLRHLRDEVVPRFLDNVLERVRVSAPNIVGFSATFNQVMSSLALAARIKKMDPRIQNIAGGACFDGEMGKEYHRALPTVLDHVFLGEAEDSFREYLRRMKAGLSTRGIAGVTSWANGALEVIPGHPLQNMNDSPMPDYDDFFLEKQRMQEKTGLVFNIEFLPFESARGCWWGQKNQCMFCGINPELMGFRSKDVDRIVSEIVTLSSRYGAAKLTSTDWIMSRWHRDELFKRLKDLDLDIELFYEVRADMNKPQLKAMKDAGITMIQPGIESFSTPLLRLMKKGTTCIRHVQFLRWCREYGIDTAYNLLVGFPGERTEWYLDMIEVIPKLRHLQPPLNNITPIEMHRFAPLFEKSKDLGVDYHEIRADYAYNFPKGSGDPQKFGYFFQFHSTETVPAAGYYDRLHDAVEPWIVAHREKLVPKYEYCIGPNFVQIIDTRAEPPRYMQIREIHQDVALLCDSIQSRANLKRDLSELYPQDVKSGRLDLVIDELIAADILLAEGNNLLLLPIARRPRTNEELRSYVLSDGGVSPDENIVDKELVVLPG